MREETFVTELKLQSQYVCRKPENIHTGDNHSKKLVSGEIRNVGLACRRNV